MEPAENRAAADDDIKRSIEALFKEADGRPVNELLARHNHERLYVRPLFWDHRQPALLQCRFLPCMRPAPPLPPLPTASPPPDDDCEEDWFSMLAKAEERMTEALHRSHDTTTLFTLLRGRYPIEEALLVPSIKFFYGRRPLCHVDYVCCMGRGICLLNTLSLRDRRVNGRVPSARQRSKVDSNGRRRSTPPQSMPDPYIAAVCIAYAQSQVLWDKKVAENFYGYSDEEVEAAEARQREQDAGGQEPAQEAQSIPIVVVAHEGEHMDVFTANVTPAFLAKLDNPREPPPPGASMDIYQQRVTFQPYDTFTARFSGAIRDTRHLCGPGDQDAGQSSSAGPEEKDSALACSTSDSPLPLRPNRAAEPGETDIKRKHSDGTDQSRAGLEENRRPRKTKKRRQVHDT